MEVNHELPAERNLRHGAATGYTAVLGGMSASHNSAQQSIDISLPTPVHPCASTETAHGDFWFEADVELLTDQAPASIGLWMTTGNGSEGLPVRTSRRGLGVSAGTAASATGGSDGRRQ